MSGGVDKNGQDSDDLDIAASLASLHRQSRLSLLLVLVGAAFLMFSLYYSASRLTPLENEITAKHAELAQLQQEEAAQKARIASLQKSFDTLKANAESLYSVKVTPSHQVYEVRATAKALDKPAASGRVQYEFALFINAPQATLAGIEKVTYHMDHESFDKKDYVSTNAAARFVAGYVGWGCLTEVQVTIQWKSGSAQQLDFDMCRSLGPQWQ